jgi:hypothetical protein
VRLPACTTNCSSPLARDRAWTRSRSGFRFWSSTSPILRKLAGPRTGPPCWPTRSEASPRYGGVAAAELAGIPLLDLLDADLRSAAADPKSDAWAELNTLSRAEVSQATGMLVAQLEIEPAEALVRLRAHAYATGRSVTDVADDILERRLQLEAD